MLVCSSRTISKELILKILITLITLIIGAVSHAGFVDDMHEESKQYCHWWDTDSSSPHTIGCQESVWNAGGEAIQAASGWLGPGQLSLVAFNGDVAVYYGGSMPEIERVKRWKKSWHPNNYTASKKAHAGKFDGLRDKDKFLRTCGIKNGSDKSSVESLTIVGNGRNKLKVTIVGLGAAGKKFESTNGTFISDKQLNFSAGKEKFKCKNFLRGGKSDRYYQLVQHLSCKYYIDGAYIGIIGFLPMGQSFAQTKSGTCAKK